MLAKKIEEAAGYVKSKVKNKLDIGLILGSGLGNLANEIEQPTSIPYREIPAFPVSTVEGHVGNFVCGKLSGKAVVAMQGRFHYYEGYSLERVTFPIRVMKALGVNTVIVTNAAGGINENFKVGDLMLITDHLNHFGTNPLIGPNEEQLGVRFPDMSQAYSSTLRELAKQVAAKQTIQLREGVYVGNSGPSYETPAEIRMLRTLGGDAVGMSTVPEVIVARHAEMEVLGISCISNMAAGIVDVALSHDEVIEVTAKINVTFTSLVKQIIKEM